VWWQAAALLRIWHEDTRGTTAVLEGTRTTGDAKPVQLDIEITQTAAVPPPVALLRMMTGYWLSKSLFVAAELGLADMMRAGPRTTDQLAVACGADSPSLYRLLRALASVGVFSETPGRRFGLTPLAEMLRSDVPGSMRSLARMYGSEQYRAWDDLLGSVTSGKPAFDRVFGASYFEFLANTPQADAVFNDAMTGWTTQVADTVVAAYDFGDVDKVVDVGGGYGLLLTTVLRAYPRMQGILLDLPHVITGAQTLLEAAGLDGRCETVGQNFFAAVTKGGDAYILAQILHDWDDERCRSILVNCRQAMRSGGKILVVEQVLPPANAPSFGKWLDLHMLVMLTGRERTETEYAALFETAGLKLTRVIPTASGACIVEGVSDQA
jgi:hypothetical protein